MTAAIGWEEDGVTTVMFRKPVTGSRDAGKSDHDFYGLLKIIWAYGQSGVDFYKEDEVKYHGGNRGSISLRKYLPYCLHVLPPHDLSLQVVFKMLSINHFFVY